MKCVVCRITPFLAASNYNNNKHKQFSIYCCVSALFPEYEYVIIWPLLWVDCKEFTVNKIVTKTIFDESSVVEEDS